MGNNWDCGFDFPNGIACWFGNFATICFFIVYLPQFILNQKRKSVTGFSLQSTIIKLIGSSFLCVNSLFNGSGLPVFLYGFLNTIQHCVFLIQFWFFSSHKKSLYYFIIPIIPYILIFIYPDSYHYTDLIKPTCQILSHIPQMLQCMKLNSTLGISMLGQHLNFLGMIFGCIMCYLQKVKSFKIWVLYLNSGFQSVSLYFLAIYYNEFRLIDSSNKRIKNEIIAPSQQLL